MEVLDRLFYENGRNDSRELVTVFTEMTRHKSTSRVMYERSMTLAAACFAVLFVIVGTTGNFLTIAALTSSPKLRKAKTTPFVINLCASHLLFCCFYLPLAASRYINEKWIHGKELCSIFPFFFHGVVGVSMLTITFIALNRYVFINHLRLYDKIYTDSNIGLMIAFCWAFAFLILLPTLKGKWGTFGHEEETFSCTIIRKDGRSPKTFLFVCGYAIPGIIILFSYCRIFYKYSKFIIIVKSLNRMGGVSFYVRKWVDRIRKKKANQAGEGKKPARTEAPPEPDELRLTCLMLVILASFMCCFSLLMIMTIVDRHFKYPNLHVLSSILVWMSSSLNPVYYVYVSKEYREAYARILCPRRRKPIIISPTSPDDEAGVIIGASEEEARQYKS